MTGRTVDNTLKLTRKVTVRMSESFYGKMEKWLAQSNCQTIAELARKILYKEKVVWYHKNAELESVAIELALIRKELNAIGKNVNQATRQLNTSPHPKEKSQHADSVLADYKNVGEKVDLLIAMILKIMKKWLQE